MCLELFDNTSLTIGSAPDLFHRKAEQRFATDLSQRQEDIGFGISYNRSCESAFIHKSTFETTFRVKVMY